MVGGRAACRLCTRARPPGFGSQLGKCLGLPVPAMRDLHSGVGEWWHVTVEGDPKQGYFSATWRKQPHRCQKARDGPDGKRRPCHTGHRAATGNSALLLLLGLMEAKSFVHLPSPVLSFSKRMTMCHLVS